MSDSVGRLSIKDYSGGVPFELHQNLGVNQNGDFTDSLKNIHQDTDLSRLFFSRTNIDFLQERIISEISKISKNEYKIARQSEEALEIVMRAMYLQHSRNLPCNIKKQVKRLNKFVLEFCIPNILTNIKQYIGYIEDLNKPRGIMPNPIDTSSKNKQLENNIGFVNMNSQSNRNVDF